MRSRTVPSTVRERSATVGCSCQSFTGSGSVLAISCHVLCRPSKKGRRHDRPLLHLASSTSCVLCSDVDEVLSVLGLNLKAKTRGLGTQGIGLYSQSYRSCSVMASAMISICDYLIRLYLYIFYRRQ